MRLAPLLASITDAILHLHGWAALALVFALPALEASAFVGFVFPGEIAVLLGGVLAYQGRISDRPEVGAGDPQGHHREAAAHPSPHRQEPGSGRGVSPPPRSSRRGAG